MTADGREAANGAALFGHGYVLTGNADLEASCVWTPTEVAAGTTPLPMYPTAAALAEIPVRE